MKKISGKVVSFRGTKRRAIRPRQITTAHLPGRLMRALVDERIESDIYLGRPYSVWKDDPELARMVNDRLADQALS